MAGFSNMWTKIQIGLGVLAFLLLFIGDRFSLPLLLYTGMACFGMVSIAIGLEAILTQQIVVGRRRRNRSTYVGIPAIFQGVQFSILGFFLIIVSIMMYMRANSREFFLEMVRRPGLPLVCLGILILMQAVITLVGSLEQRSGQHRDSILSLLLSRLLPGAIFVLVGLVAVGLGFFEIVAPHGFDSMGGGFLETLYGLR